jgi:hypothetical protein
VPCHARADDTSSTSQTYQSSRLSWAAWALGLSDFFGPAGSAPPLDAAGLRALFQQHLQFVGVSAYAPLSGPGFATKELENAAFTLGVGRAGWGGVTGEVGPSSWRAQAEQAIACGFVEERDGACPGSRRPP